MCGSKLARFAGTPLNAGLEPVVDAHESSRRKASSETFRAGRVIGIGHGVCGLFCVGQVFSRLNSFQFRNWNNLKYCGKCTIATLNSSKSPQNTFPQSTVLCHGVFGLFMALYLVSAISIPGTELSIPGTEVSLELTPHRLTTPALLP